MKIRWQTASLALVLAIFTWFLVTGREKVESWIPVAVEMIGAQEGLIIHEGLVNQLDVRVRGPRELVRSLKEQKLGYPLDVSTLKVGKNAIEMDPENLDISDAYEIMEIKPPRLLLTVDRMSKKSVPVTVTWTGEESLNRDYKLVELGVTPAFVALDGPESLLEPMTEAHVVLEKTFEEEVPERWSTDLPVITPEGVEATPGLVHIELRLGPKTQVIPVKIRSFVLDAPDDLDVSIATKEITLQIEGPIFLFRNDDFRSDVVISATIEPSVGAGKHQLPISVSLPENCSLVDSEPETLSVVVKK